MSESDRTATRRQYWREYYKARSQKENYKLWYSDHLKRMKRWYLDNKEKFQDERLARRAEVIAEYGGQCSCCGETIEEFLTIDHVNGRENPKADRKKRHGGDTLYKWLRARGYPKDAFRLLCWNCNSGRRLGPCPHERIKLKEVPHA